ncbi:hypothetical protein Salat_2784100 [Sesamum alatum]|uniref:Uncharacterized protein n=1 Tax=Sesamum alatum TaxID=300844 RepID=A0AAE1XLR5_9LAMI|nr:hypothetical protein Salat_2784100 [Sesamum alatum]
MDPTLKRLGKASTLVEEEGNEVVLLSGLWHNVDDLDGFLWMRFIGNREEKEPSYVTVIDIPSSFMLKLALGVALILLRGLRMILDRVEGADDMRALIVLYFTKLFESGHPSEEEIDLGVEHIMLRVDERMA